MNLRQSDPNLKELWRRMVALEEDAYREFAELFGQRFRMLFMSHGLPLAKAEDLAVSCATDVALNLDRYSPKRGHFDSWVLKLARRTLADCRRKHPPSLSQSDDSSIPPEAEENSWEFAGAGPKAMLELPERHEVLARWGDLEGAESLLSDRAAAKDGPGDHVGAASADGAPSEAHPQQGPSAPKPPGTTQASRAEIDIIEIDEAQIWGGRAEADARPRWPSEAMRLWHETALFELSGKEREEVPSTFRERCRAAAGNAMDLIRLRTEQERVGFVALSLADYLRGLAKMTGVALVPILEAFGIADLSLPTPEAGPAFGRLCRALGFGLREALVHLRIGFAEQLDAAPVAILAARSRQRAGRRSPLKDCEAALAQLAKQYHPKTAAQLRALEIAVSNTASSAESVGGFRFGEVAEGVV